MEKKICIWGAGAMGTLLAACLTEAGCPVVLAEANPKRVAQLKKDGVVVTGNMDFRGMIPVETPDALDGTYDLVFLLTKQVHNQAAFPQIAAHIHPDSVICTLQNGVPEPSLEEYFGQEHVLGCAVTWAATTLPDGSTEATSRRDLWHSALGRRNGVIDRKVEETAEILRKMCLTIVSENLIGIRWSKLLVNSSFSGMSAALGCTFGEILDDPKAFSCAQHVARECIRVARRLDIRMEDLGSDEDFMNSFDFNTLEERLNTRTIYQKLWGGTRDGVASMLPDLRNHRKTEISYIDGYVSREGEKCGVPTPYTDTIVSIVERCERGIWAPGMENVYLFPEEEF